MSPRVDPTNPEHIAAIRDVCDTILTVRGIHGPPDDRTYERLRLAMSTNLKREALAQVWIPEEAAALIRAIVEAKGIEVLGHRAMPMDEPDESLWATIKIRAESPLAIAWAMRVVPLVILDLLAATNETTALAALQRSW